MRSIIYKVLQFLFLLSIFITYNSCKDSPVDPPPDNKPPGYQEDISWPSLGSSAWPTKNADMQRTGRSKYIGPQQGVIVSKVHAPQMEAGIAFADDSIFYFTTSSRFVDSTKLMAAKTDGTILWSFDLNSYSTNTTPLVDINGVIYIANGSSLKIFAVNPDGTVKWVYQTATEVFNRGLGLGKDGTLYAVQNDQNLIAISRDGNFLWSLYSENFMTGYAVNLTFSPDGNTLYANGYNSSVIAVDLVSKSIKWKFGRKTLRNGPMVDSRGNIYVLTDDDSLDSNVGNFYCLNPNGEIKWKYPHHRNGNYVATDPTIDKDGNIYFGTDTLYAVNYSGELRWKLHLKGGDNYSPLICDAQGTVYVGVQRNFRDGEILAVSKDGVIKWAIPITEERELGDCPAISKNGILIYPTWRSDNFYIIK
jgi:outer membrane protein assembly factor BamB